MSSGAAGRSARAEAWCWRPVAFLTTRGFASNFFLVERGWFPPSLPRTTGDGLHVAMAGGASQYARATNAAYWVPASLFRRADGSQGVFPHTVTDRAKPGVIAVNASGRRFVNEAVSYHEFVLAMLREGNDATNRSFYLICDRRFLWTYGLGRIKPFAVDLKRIHKSGELIEAPSLDALAEAIGVEKSVLVDDSEKL